MEQEEQICPKFTCSECKHAHDITEDRKTTVNATPVCARHKAHDKRAAEEWSTNTSKAKNSEARPEGGPRDSANEAGAARQSPQY